MVVGNQWKVVHWEIHSGVIIYVMGNIPSYSREV
jgi:hypothetical protein